MEFINSLENVNRHYSEYKKWEKEQDTLDAKKEYLAEHSADANSNSFGKAKAVLNAVDIMDQYSQNKAEQTEAITDSAMGTLSYLLMSLSVAVGALSYKIPFIKKTGENLCKLLNNSKNKFIKNNVPKNAGKFVIPGLIGFGFIITSESAAIIYSTHLQKLASKIGRFQSRRDKLQDPKNFIEYTPEQIKEAEQLAQTLPLEKIEKEKNKNMANPLEAFREAKSLIKDNENYEKWFEQNEVEERENKKNFKKQIAPDVIKKAKADRDLIFRITRRMDIASQDYAENCELATSTITSVALAGGLLTSWVSNKIMKALKLKSNNKIITFLPTIIGGVTTFAGIIYAAKLQLEASKIGKYKVRQQLLTNPKMFDNYTKEQLDSVKNENIDCHKDSFLDFCLNLPKDYKAYHKYLKEEKPKEVRLQKALDKVSVSEEQIKKAKSLQKNTFKTFEKVDEMSQRYAEDVESFSQIIGTASVLIAVGISQGLFLRKSFSKNVVKKVNNDVNSMISETMLRAWFPLIPAIGINMWATKKQKDASKVSHMLAMKELQDPKNFVDYSNF